MSCNPVREVTQAANAAVVAQVVTAVATPLLASPPVRDAGNADESDPEDFDYVPSETNSDECSDESDTDDSSNDGGDDVKDDRDGIKDDEVLFVGGPIFPHIDAAGNRVGPEVYNPPAVPVRTAYKFVQTVGPFIAGVPYGVIPDYMRFNPDLDSKEYWVIAKGLFVGIVTCKIVAQAATDCHAPLCAPCDNQTAAVNKFNNLLAMDLVAIA